MVGGHPVLRGVDATRVLSHVSSNGAGRLAGRIRGVVIPIPADLLSEPDVDHARLEHGPLVWDVHVEDTRHPIESDDDPALDRQGTTGEASPGAPGEKIELLPMTELDDFRNLVGGRGKDHDIRQGSQDCRAVALVHAQFLFRVDDSMRPNDLLEFPDDLPLVFNHGCLPRSPCAVPGTVIVLL